MDLTEENVSERSALAVSSNLVSFSEHGIVEVVDPVLLDVVGAGGLFEAEVKVNGVCGSDVNMPCYGSNAGCVASPNVACGSNTVCSEADTPV